MIIYYLNVLKILKKVNTIKIAKECQTIKFIFSYSKYSSFSVDGGDISKVISRFLRIEMTKLFFKLNYSNVLINDEDNNMFFKWFDI